jgi:hypothetical protein
MMIKGEIHMIADTQGQPFLAIQALDSFVIDLKALTAQQQIEHRTAPAPSLFGQFTQPLT